MVDNRLREKAASRYLSRLFRQEQKEKEEEEEACILQHPQLEEEDEVEEGGETNEEEEQLQCPGHQCKVRRNKEPHSKKVHVAFSGKRSQSLEEQTDGEKPKNDFWKALKKFGENCMKALGEACNWDFDTNLHELTAPYHLLNNQPPS
ncbi:uncharacterized protein C1orf115 homolog [Dromiciops gliroides]|uniref:uncharacterized protein C1orf115 homolog n=1 Tax=Dromiciops gliroides TaxID=33562 RepID=UPI001CC4F94B|nr:uncharacterized protein C1orf115 homolog [Dromiciops gliroides]